MFKGTHKEAGDKQNEAPAEKCDVSFITSCNDLSHLTTGHAAKISIKASRSNRKRLRSLKISHFRCAKS